MGEIKLNKWMVTAGISALLVVVCGGAGGALFALNMEKVSNKNDKGVNEIKEVSSEKPAQTDDNPNGWRNTYYDWYFYKDNKKQIGWIQNNGRWYYLGSDGKMKTGWIEYKNKSYYLNYDGSMVINTTIDGKYLNSNGLIEDSSGAVSYIKQADAYNNDPDKISVETARGLIYSNIDADDRVFLKNEQTKYIEEVTPDSNDDQARKIYVNLRVKENMYKFKGSHNSLFFVNVNTGDTYLFDAGGDGKIGSGIYAFQNGKRTESWRIGEWGDDSYIVHSSAGEDWAKL